MRGRSWMMAAAALLALAAGCAKKDEAPAVDLAAEEKAIWDRSAEWMKAAQTKDAAAVVNGFFAPDAITVFDGELTTGTAAIQAGFEEEYSTMPDATLAWTTTSVKVASAGDMAWETGAFTFDPDGAGTTPAVSGHFVTIWSKSDGTWRVVVDSGSSTRPAEAAPAEAAPAAG